MKSRSILMLLCLASAPAFGQGRAGPPMDCEQGSICWFAADESGRYIAYGKPETDATPLLLGCGPRGQVSLRGFMPAARGERFRARQRVRITLTGPEWSRPLDARAVEGDGWSFEAAIERDHPLLRSLIAGHGVHYSRSKEGQDIPGHGAKVVIEALLRACGARTR